MKKFNILLAATVALGFVACEDDSDLGVAQVNPQLPEISANGLTATLSTTAVNLDSNVGNLIPMISAQSMENLPENASVTFDMEVSTDEDFSNPTTLTLKDGEVSADEWEDYILSSYGKSPDKTVNYVRFAAYVESGTQLSRLGGEDYWYLPSKIEVTPVDLKLDVESSYSIVINGVVGDALSHSDRHVYDDPNFHTSIEVSDDQAAQGVKWMIAPVSALSGNSSQWYGVSETQSATDLSGNLMLGGQTGEFNQAGSYTINVNMLEKTYSITFIATGAYETLTTPGDANVWDAAASTWQLTTSDYSNYYGFAWLSGEFKIATGSWDVNWGLGDSDGTLSLGGANMSVDEAGLYYLNVNIADLTYSITKVENVGATGDFDGWNAGEPTMLTVSEDGVSIKGDVTFPGDGGWKFVFNQDWDINLGGTDAELVPNGANLPAPGEGTYEITLNLSTLPYTYSITAK